MCTLIISNVGVMRKRAPTNRMMLESEALRKEQVGQFRQVRDGAGIMTSCEVSCNIVLRSPTRCGCRERGATTNAAGGSIGEVVADIFDTLSSFTLSNPTPSHAA
ncbi:MAG: hypothetical protein K2K76_08425 [Muribaculaceae bacterium]|nr:hypothetical protein [Muribaculaceae bacterium]